MSTTTSKNQEKKILKKQIRAQHAITADTQIECSNQPTENLVICNAGLATGLQQDVLLQAAAPFGSVRSCVMLPGKSYCFLRCGTPDDARRVFAGLHGATTLAQNAGVLYLSYCAGVPTVPSTWDGPLPAGLQLIEDFVSVAEEQQLLANCCSSNVATGTLKHRHVQHFGYEFLYDTNNVDRSAPLLDRPIPAACSLFWPRLDPHSDIGAPLFRPDQLTVNVYEPGQGIPPHVDTHSPFVEPIVSLSLGDGVVMDFRRPATGAQRSVWLPARSLLVMRGEARYAWTHGITPRHMDVVPMADDAAAAGGGLTVRVRSAKRVSLTFRQLRSNDRCSCDFAELCDSRQTTAAAGSNGSNDAQPSPAALELSNVHSVYDTIAGHFSETRHSPWPLVSQFVLGLGAGAVLADIGCGNGKYLVGDGTGAVGGLRLGGDRSAGLLAVCRERGLNVFRCDCLQVPLRDGCADGCICIAVVHHLATEDRRLHALREIARILRPGGQALIYVWAKNQAKDSRQSSYLRQNKRNLAKDAAGETIDQLPAAAAAAMQPEVLVEYVNGLPVHTNRTQFAAQDMLVPWKLRADTVNGTTTSKPQQFLRFYHVFEEGELEALVARVDGIQVVRSYYDQGNWCVVFARTKLECPN